MLKLKLREIYLFLLNKWTTRVLRDHYWVTFNLKLLKTTLTRKYCNFMCSAFGNTGMILCRYVVCIHERWTVDYFSNKKPLVPLPPSQNTWKQSRSKTYFIPLSVIQTIVVYNRETSNGNNNTGFTKITQYNFLRRLMNRISRNGTKTWHSLSTSIIREIGPPDLSPLRSFDKGL